MLMYFNAGPKVTLHLYSTFLFSTRIVGTLHGGGDRFTSIRSQWGHMLYTVPIIFSISAIWTCHGWSSPAERNCSPPETTGRLDSQSAESCSTGNPTVARWPKILQNNSKGAAKNMVQRFWWPLLYCRMFSVFCWILFLQLAGKPRSGLAIVGSPVLCR